MEYEHLTHSFAPVYNKDSRILILGSFPSVKSREQNFYYGHPQNRFWKVIASLTGWGRVPVLVEEKRRMLLENGIAVWDVIFSCDIIGSSDSSIKNVVPNPLEEVLEQADIRQIYTNGKTAGKLYEKYIREKTGRECRMLPSTSPANAACNLDELIRVWGENLEEYLKKQE